MTAAAATPVATPNLDKARTDELTTGEVVQALRELTALNGGVGVLMQLHPTIRIECRYSGYCAAVDWRVERLGFDLAWHASVEDALVAEHAAINRQASYDEAEG